MLNAVPEVPVAKVKLFPVNPLRLMEEIKPRVEVAFGVYVPLALPCKTCPGAVACGTVILIAAALTAIVNPAPIKILAKRYKSFFIKFY